MTVKFGAVHTGELGFAAYGDAAGAAHADAVNHDGVEADRGLDAKWARGFRHGGHHGHGADRNDFKHVLVFFKPVAQKLGNKALVAVTAIVRGNKQFIHKGFELVFKEQQVFAASADNAHDLVADACMALGNVVHGGNTGAAAHAYDRAAFFNMGGVAQGAADVKNGISNAECFKHGGTLAHNQIHYGNGAVFPVSICNGQRNALALFAHAQHDEVAGARFLRDLRRVEHQFAGFARDQAFLVQYRCWHRFSSSGI